MHLYIVPQVTRLMPSSARARVSKQSNFLRKRWLERVSRVYCSLFSNPLIHYIRFYDAIPPATLKRLWKEMMVAGGTVELDVLSAAFKSSLECKASRGNLWPGPMWLGEQK
jgi:hypothetical protein